MRGKAGMTALDVKRGAKYTLTYIPVDWRCPYCDHWNNTTLIEEEDLCWSQDNAAACLTCEEKSTIKADDILKNEN